MTHTATWPEISVMSGEGLRQSVLNSTDQIRQQLLDAVDRLDRSGTSSSIAPPAPQLPPVRPPPLPRSPYFSQPSTSGGMLQRPFLLANVRKRSGRGMGYSKGGNKRKRLPTWSHTFVCLSNKDKQTVPDSSERAALLLAGLGEKKVTFDEFCNHQEIKSELEFGFPKLLDSGGFELLRIQEGGGKTLHSIETPKNGFTVPFLRAVVHHAVIYIRPLQKNLSTEEDACSTMSLDAPPMEKCLVCNEYVLESELRVHLVQCRRSSSSPSALSLPSVSSVPSTPSFQPLPSVPSAPPLPSVPSTPSIAFAEAHQDVCVDLTAASPEVEDLLETENSILRATIDLSRVERPASPAQPENLADVVSMLKKKHVKEEEFSMIVRRSHLLSDAFKRMARPCFSPSKSMLVEFVGEDGLDNGGLTREFFSWFGHALQGRFLSSTGCFIHNSVAMQRGEYHCIGQLCAMALVHGGGALNVFAPSVYNFMCAMKACDIVVSCDEVADEGIRDLLDKVQSACDHDTLQEVVMENADEFFKCGYTKPIARIVIADKVDIVQSVALQHVVLSTLGELTQFCDGLSSLGVGSALKEFKELMHSFFCKDTKTKLSAEDIRELFRVQYSAPGSTARSLETATYMMFLDYLYECEAVSRVQEVVDEDRDIETPDPAMVNKVFVCLSGQF